MSRSVGRLDEKEGRKTAAVSKAVATVPPTRSTKGSRTRQSLLDSARKIFARDGFLGARVTDIATEAGLAHGTFYRYFDSKEEILHALVDDTVQELFAESARGRKGEDSYARLTEGTRGYLEVYRNNADIMRVLIEAAMTNEEFAAIWRDTRQRFIERIRHSIERNQRAGLVRSIDPSLAASALGGMVEHFAFVSFVFDANRTRGKMPSFDEITDALASLWWHALIREPPGDGPPAQRQRSKPRRA